MGRRSRAQVMHANRRTHAAGTALDAVLSETVNSAQVMIDWEDHDYINDSILNLENALTCLNTSYFYHEDGVFHDEILVHSIKIPVDLHRVSHAVLVETDSGYTCDYVVCPAEDDSAAKEMYRKMKAGITGTLVLNHDFNAGADYLDSNLTQKLSKARNRKIRRLFDSLVIKDIVLLRDIDREANRRRDKMFKKKYSTHTFGKVSDYMLTIGTDASQGESDDVTCGVAWVREDGVFDGRVIYTPNIDTGELNAIGDALSSHPDQDVHIITDSMNSVKWIKDYTGNEDSKIHAMDCDIQEAVVRVVNLVGDRNVHIEWTKGHADNKLNRAADMLSRKIRKNASEEIVAAVSA